MTTLTEKDFLNFWIRVYFHGNPDIVDASIDRAYRDFNRTVHGLGEERTNGKYQNLKYLMKKISKEVSELNIKSQEEFDL